MKILIEQKEVLLLQIKHLRTEEQLLQEMVDEYLEESEDAVEQARQAVGEMKRLEI